MASFSPSSTGKSFKYDVYLSYCAQDTSDDFVEHLYDAFVQKSIHTYKNDEKIEQGRKIDDQRIRSIQNSKISIVVLSKDYASSCWCLDELVTIMECHKTTEHTVYAVFYDVDPSEVRNQSGAVGEAFAKRNKEEAAGKWRQSLKEAANLGGWDLSKGLLESSLIYEQEAKVIQKIVEGISLELRYENLVGSKPLIKGVLASLEINFADMLMKGIGGAGRTENLTLDSVREDGRLSFEVGQDHPKTSPFLRLLHIYPIQSLSATFWANNLVTLRMPHSRITQLWEGEGGERRVLNNLRFLDLSRSMLTTLDLKPTPRLERLELAECRELVDLPTPVGSLTRLGHLNLIGCSSFDSFSFIKRLESLEVLSLSKLHLTAKSIQKFSRRTNMSRLVYTCFCYVEVPLSSRDGLKFVSLKLKGSIKLKNVSRSIQNLRYLTWDGSIPEVPNNLDRLNCLEKLSFWSTRINRLPDSICMLRRLRSLEVKSCLLLESLPENLGQLQHLEKLTLLSAPIKRLPDSICLLECLKSLKLESCRFLERLPEDLGKLGCLEKLILTECMSLEEIPNSICEMNNLKRFHLPFCVRVKELPKELGQLKCLRELNVKGTGISHLPLSLSLVEDLCIVGSLAVLKSYRFAPKIQTSEGETFCYIQAVNNTCTDRQQRFESIPSMASSTSSTHKSFKYDVFLSFRGEDTSETFVRHLHAAFQRQGTHTYMDDGEVGQGRNDEVIRSIQDSKIFIIVFSKNYASSSRCLDELVKMIECHKTTEYTAYPVFYDVEPSEVHKQTGAVGKAFGKLNKEVAVGKWRQALKEAANLSGWDMRSSNTDGNEAKFIENIVEDIWVKLCSINVCIERKIIGMEPQIDEVFSSSVTGVGDVHIIGITGTEGVGKTTLARAIFDRLSFRFEGRSFVEKVREVSKHSSSGLKSLQEQVLSDVLDEGILISSVSKGKNMIENKLNDRTVLVVLDDVNQLDQLEALAGSPNWFGKGSIIIITTSDEEMLLKHGVKQIHRVRALPEKEALCLFSWFAFGGAKPDEEYGELSLEVVQCAGGLPLAIKVLGSFLRGKNKPEWNNMLQRLKEISLDEGLKEFSFEHNQEILELSYNSLEDDTKGIFLNIACFMNGFRENDAVRILESCGFNARDGLRVLVRKSLVTISDDHRLGMHGCIEYMGRNIVRRLHPDQPNQHSRLWVREEIEYVLANDLGTGATRCMQLLELELSPSIVMEGVGRMEDLRCLIVESENDNDDLSGDWEFDEVRQYLPNALGFLRWVHYPFQSLPVTFQASNLVTLELPDSRITQLWEDGERQVLPNLRFLDLSRSLLTTLDLELTPRIEWLELKECHGLVALLTPVGSLTRLFHLDLSGCSSFDSYSFIRRLESLGVLSLSKLHLTAKPLQEYPRGFNIPRLEFTCSYSEEVPSSSRDDQTKSVSLNLKRSPELKSASGSICCLHHIRCLTLEGCIPEVPNDLDRLQCLEKLTLFSTPVKCLPDSICMLKHLKSLKLESCQNLEELPGKVGLLVSLEELSLLSTGIRHLPDGICMLKHLKSLILKPCSLLERLPENFGNLKCLEKLSLLSARIKCLPDSIWKLKNLKSLELESCGFLQRLPEDLGKLDCLEKLILTECMSLEDIPNSICTISNLKWLHLLNCDKVKKLPEQLGHLQCLIELNVKGTSISQLPLSISLVEDLRIVGSVAVLQSCDVISKIQTTEGESFCFIQPWNWE